MGKLYGEEMVDKINKKNVENRNKVYQSTKHNGIEKGDKINKQNIENRNRVSQSGKQNSEKTDKHSSKKAAVRMAEKEADMGLWGEKIEQSEKHNGEITKGSIKDSINNQPDMEQNLQIDGTSGTERAAI